MNALYATRGFPTQGLLKQVRLQGAIPLLVAQAHHQAHARAVVFHQAVGEQRLGREQPLLLVAASPRRRLAQVHGIRDGGPAGPPPGLFSLFALSLARPVAAATYCHLLRTMAA